MKRTLEEFIAGIKRRAQRLRNHQIQEAMLPIPAKRGRPLKALDDIPEPEEKQLAEIETDDE